MNRIIPVLIFAALAMLVCVTGYYGFQRQMAVMAADWARLKAVFPWVLGVVGFVVVCFGAMALWDSVVKVFKKPAKKVIK